MDKAYIDFDALYRMQNVDAFFVTRAKDTMRYEVVEQNFNIDQTTGLRSDKTVLLTVAKSKKLYPEKLRLVEFYDQVNSELLVFLTNNFEVTALEVANLYKNRWQMVSEPCRTIEVFFKWIKQNLSIKKFWGHSENAVRIQLWVAIIAYLLVAYVKHSLKSNLSIYEIMQILGVSAFDRTPIRELLTDFQPNLNVKELQYNLFDNC
jgi:IS4 transposase